MRVNLDYFIKLLTLSESVFSPFWVASQKDFCVTDATSPGLLHVNFTHFA